MGFVTVEAVCLKRSKLHSIAYPCSECGLPRCEAIGRSTNNGRPARLNWGSMTCQQTSY